MSIATNGKQDYKSAEVLFEVLTLLKENPDIKIAGKLADKIEYSENTLRNALNLLCKKRLATKILKDACISKFEYSISEIGLKFLNHYSNISELEE